MLVLGVLLIVIAAIVALLVLIAGGASSVLDLGGQTITTTASALFVLGAATAAVLVLGLWLIKVKAKRSHKKRVSARDDRKAQESERHHLEAEVADRDARLAGHGGASDPQQTEGEGVVLHDEDTTRR